LIYAERGDSANAVTELRVAVQQKPDYAQGWFTLGSTLKSTGDLDGAIEALRRSVTLDGHNAGAFNTLALALRQNGDLAGSKKAFAQAAEIRKQEDREKSKLLRQGPARREP
jgi:Flp pilus assembly protein TadD